MSTDLHGNLEDFEALRTKFLNAVANASSGDVHWAQLGDIVHGPDDASRRASPELYGYEDRSHAIARGFLDLIAAHPGRVHYVLGNHDHGHVGGPHTSKFRADEVASLEATLSIAQRADLRELFDSALYVVAAPCGLFLSHGSPDDEAISSLDDLDRIPLVPKEPRDVHSLRQLLTSYGQSRDVTARLLARLSSPGLELNVVVHGHDRDESGYFVEGDNQLCPCIFGAPRENKRYLSIDLAKRYATARDLSDGVEIQRLYSA